jgi:hypothetical protein
MKHAVPALVAALLAAVGCTAIDDAMYPGVRQNLEAPTAKVAPAIAEGHGRIWIYRLVPKGPGVPPIVSVDRRYNAYLLPHPSLHVDLPPGPHRIALDSGKGLDVDLKADEEVFVRVDLDPALFGKGFHPVRVDVPTGRREYKAHSGIDTEALAPR